MTAVHMVKILSFYWNPCTKKYIKKDKQEMSAYHQQRLTLAKAGLRRWALPCCCCLRPILEAGGLIGGHRCWLDTSSSTLNTNQFCTFFKRQWNLILGQQCPCLPILSQGHSDSSVRTNFEGLTCVLKRSDQQKISSSTANMMLFGGTHF